jgi:hypothetical protein
MAFDPEGTSRTQIVPYGGGKAIAVPSWREFIYEHMANASWRLPEIFYRV